MDIKSGTPKPARHALWQLFGRFDDTIGVLWPDYGSAHVIYGLNTQRYKHSSLQTVSLKYFDNGSTFYTFTPLVLDFSLPLVHTWNAIPYNKDFIVSFELELPRYLGSPTPSQLQRGMKWLDGARCKKILALSEFAFRYAHKRLERNGSSQAIAKLAVFRGAVADPLNGAALPDTPRASFDGEPFSAIVVGSHLFRKGGMHALLAFERLRNAGLNVRLTLIGRFETECYAFREELPIAAEWQKRAESHHWVDFKGPLPNASVLKELRAHDICLYPSMDESLGWLTIEAGMAGLPVVGNRICAFPELIEHGRTGWLINLPIDEDGRWAGIGMHGDLHRAAVRETSEAIVDGIEACVRHLYDSPWLIREWGGNARQRMLGQYSMKSAAVELERIYDDALGRLPA